MTEQELKNELERIVKEEYPVIASRYVDKEIMLREAQDMNYEVTEWRGLHFSYKSLHKRLIGLVASQFLTTGICRAPFLLYCKKNKGF